MSGCDGGPSERRGIKRTRAGVVPAREFSLCRLFRGGYGRGFGVGAGRQVQDGKGSAGLSGDEGGKLAVPGFDLVEADQGIREGFGDELVGFRLGFAADLDGIGVGIGIDLGHVGLGLGVDALTLGLLLGFHGHLGLLDFRLELALGGYLLGFDGVGEGVGEVNVLDAEGDDIDAIILQLLVEAVPDGFAEGLAVGHQIFDGVLGEDAFRDLQHAGVD